MSLLCIGLLCGAIQLDSSVIALRFGTLQTGRLPSDKRTTSLKKVVSWSSDRRKEEQERQHSHTSSLSEGSCPSLFSQDQFTDLDVSSQSAVLFQFTFCLKGHHALYLSETLCLLRALFYRDNITTTTICQRRLE